MSLAILAKGIYIFFLCNVLNYCVGFTRNSMKSWKIVSISKSNPFNSLKFHLSATVSDKSAEVLEESTKKKRKSKSLKQNGDEEDSVSSKKKKKTLVIVESPAKAKTIQKILNSEEYIVESCYGHVRDLCKSVRVVEEDYLHGFVSKDLRIKVGTLGVDVYNNFAPIYVAADKQAVVIERLRKLARGCDLIVLATDEDREGEAISWHLLEVLKPKAPHKRAVFHEITKTAILESFQNLRDIDMNLVQSQETRRILDRLTGYTLSPVLWRYISFGMSAGRVQSCGLKLIVDVSAVIGSMNMSMCA